MKPHMTEHSSEPQVFGDDTADADDSTEGVSPQKRGLNVEAGNEASSSAPMWLWWIPPACVLIVAVVVMSGSPPTSHYGPNGSIIIGKRDTVIVDHIDPERHSVTSCIDDKSIPAPKEHPCQKYGH